MLPFSVFPCLSCPPHSTHKTPKSLSILLKGSTFTREGKGAEVEAHSHKSSSLPTSGARTLLWTQVHCTPPSQGKAQETVPQTILTDSGKRGFFNCISFVPWQAGMLRHPHLFHRACSMGVTCSPCPVQPNTVACRSESPRSSSYITVAPDLMGMGVSDSSCCILTGTS